MSETIETTESVEETGLNSKEMIAKNAKNGTKIRYNDRVTVKILKKTKYYHEGQIISPHRVVAEQLIAEKTAKEVK